MLSLRKLQLSPRMRGPCHKNRTNRRACETDLKLACLALQKGMRKVSQSALALLALLFAHFSWASGLSCKQVYTAIDFLNSSQIQVVEQLKKGMSSQAYSVQSGKGKSIFLRNLHIEANLKMLNALREDEQNFLVSIAKLPFVELRKIVAESYSHQNYDFKALGLKVPDVAPTSYEGRRTEALKEIAGGIAELIVNFEYLKKLESFQYHGKNLAPQAQAVIVDAKLGFPVGMMIEYLPGKDLAYLVENHQISILQIEKVKVQVLEQLALLHGNGLLHGDINPGNIMIQMTAAGEPLVRLIDFTPPEIAVFKTPTVEKAMFESFLLNLQRNNSVRH